LNQSAAATLHVIFKVAQAQYVLAASDVLHMDCYEGATRVPGTAPWVAGLVQVRRRVVPAVDLRLRFGLSPLEPTLQSRVLVVQDGPRTVGLLADSAREVIHIPADSFHKPPEVVTEQAQGFVKAVAQVGERLLMLIDIHAVVGPELVAAAASEEAQHGE
jgi:purine-binding chemotaxis protein CheW